MDCEGWWLSGRSSVAEHWQLKPGTMGSIPSDCRLFNFLDFLLITSSMSVFMARGRWMSNPLYRDTCNINNVSSWLSSRLRVYE